jgi:hypothetical protein
MTTGNRQLAAQARDIANAAAPGTLQRRAAGVTAVCLATTRNLTAARQVLDAAGLDSDVHQAAAQLLDELTTGRNPA